MMLASREAVVDYMTPLGLHHLMARGHHYGPGPWVERRAARRLDVGLLPPRRRRRASASIARATGSNAVEPVRAAGARRASATSTRVPDDYLLWFHHVPWDHRMASGRTLWDELRLPLPPRRRRGARDAGDLGRRSPAAIDRERYDETRAFLAIQEKEARWWRDACVLYFQTFSKLPIPPGYEKPEHDLEYYKAINKKYVPGI